MKTENIINSIITRLPAKYNKNDLKEIIYCLFLADCTIAETAKRINKSEKYVFTVYQIIKTYGKNHSRKELC